MMATSSRSLFPATTTIELSDVFPEQSRWIFGGSGGRDGIVGNLGVDRPNPPPQDLLRSQVPTALKTQEPHLPQIRSPGPQPLLPQTWGSRPPAPPPSDPGVQTSVTKAAPVLTLLGDVLHLDFWGT